MEIKDLLNQSVRNWLENNKVKITKYIKDFDDISYWGENILLFVELDSEKGFLQIDIYDNNTVYIHFENGEISFYYWENISFYNYLFRKESFKELNINFYFDQFINNWLENIELDYFGWNGDGYPDFDKPFLERGDCDTLDKLTVRATDKSQVNIVLFNDGIRNPLVYFDGNDFSFSYKADLSVCESITKLMTEKYPNYMKEYYGY